MQGGVADPPGQLIPNQADLTAKGFINECIL